MDPSRGGIGTRLNNPSPTLSTAVPSRKSNSHTVTAFAGAAPAIIDAHSISSRASSILDTGPARAVRAMPRLGFLKYRISTGTGLAQPKPQMTMEARPSQSIWCRGLKLSRRIRLAVGSPRA